MVKWSRLEELCVLSDGPLSAKAPLVRGGEGRGTRAKNHTKP